MITAPFSHGPQQMLTRDRLVEWMTGSFSSAKQAKANPEFHAVEFRSSHIWPDRDDGYAWIYVERALAATPERPYCQRVYRVEQSGPSTFVLGAFELPGDPLVYAGAWKDDVPLAKLSPETLVRLDGCDQFLRALGPWAVSGQTAGIGCANSAEGAAHETSEVTIREWMIEVWDRGFDASGAQVWGSTAGPYKFEKLDLDPRGKGLGR